MELGDKIKKASKERKIPLYKIAIYIGVSEPTFHSYLNKNDMSAKQIEMIAKLLNKNASYFLSENKNSVNEEKVEYAKDKPNSYIDTLEELKEVNKENRELRAKIRDLETENNELRSQIASKNDNERNRKQ